MDEREEPFKGAGKALVGSKRLENLRSKGDSALAGSEGEGTCESLLPWVFSELLVGTRQVFSIALLACCFVTGWLGARAEARLRLPPALWWSSAFRCWLAGQGLTLWSTPCQGAEGQQEEGLPMGMGPGVLEPLLPQWGGVHHPKGTHCNFGLQACVREKSRPRDIFVLPRFWSGRRRCEGLGSISLLEFHKSFLLVSFGCWAFPPH